MESDQIEIENILHHLNYRWNVEALAQWEGTSSFQTGSDL